MISGSLTTHWTALLAEFWLNNVITKTCGCCCCPVRESSGFTPFKLTCVHGDCDHMRSTYIHCTPVSDLFLPAFHGIPLDENIYDMKTEELTQLTGNWWCWLNKANEQNNRLSFAFYCHFGPLHRIGVHCYCYFVIDSAWRTASQAVNHQSRNIRTDSN